MPAAESQQSSRVDTVPHAHTSLSDEPSNAQPFAQPSKKLSVSPVAAKHRARAIHIPPPAPSPPTYSSRRSPPVASNKQLDSLPSMPMAVRDVEPQSQWLFTEEEIHNSPSVLDGISVAEESSRRAKGVNFITQAGILLKIPQLTLGTAAVFFHRFFMRYSMVQEKGGLHHYVRPSLPRSKTSQSNRAPLTSALPEQNIAATALFLATKAEENCRKTKEIVIAVVKVAQKNASLIIDEQSKEFWRWRDSILLYEETMLELLTFDVVLESPYNCLYNFLKELKLEKHKDMRNVAWAFLNDSCMTTLCLLMGPRDIAIAAIYFAVKFHNERVPDENGAPWWVRLGGVPQRITKAIDIMTEFYTDNPLKKGDNPYNQSPGSSAEDLERTRLRVESTSPPQRPTDQNEEERQSPAEARTNGNTQEGNANHEEGEEQQLDSGAGDDDTKLKELANDPATHESSHVNGVPNGFAPADGKRKEASMEPGEESFNKKIRLDNGEEESEEGEVEE
jgi:protein BUR2